MDIQYSNIRWNTTSSHTVLMHMRILSIDVGIKNLAICAITVADGKLTAIDDWEVINLCAGQPTCGYATRKGLCGKNAVFSKDGSLYCKPHAAKTEFTMPKDVPTCAALRRRDMADLGALAETYHVTDKNLTSKTKLATAIRAAMLEVALAPVAARNANTIELPELAKILYKELDATLELTLVDEVIIENQISPVAGRMKCLQSMLTQYFAMRCAATVKFVSAANKLRFFPGPKKTYAERKKLSVAITESFLAKTSSPHADMFANHAKKDDLADALLQGFAYLVDSNHLDNIFLSADYLK